MKTPFIYMKIPFVYILWGIFAGSVVSLAVILIIVQLNDLKLVNTPPKFHEGQCAAYWLSGTKFYKDTEEWQQDQVIPAFRTMKIMKVGKKNYLVETHYDHNSPNRVRPNETEPVEKSDRTMELIDCSRIDSILESE
jgi:hypothetical protein